MFLGYILFCLWDIMIFYISMIYGVIVKDFCCRYNLYGFKIDEK